MEFNLADLWECVADVVPDRVALVCRQRRLTYRELDRRATRLAHGLAQLGVGCGQHVGLFLYNCAEFVEAMLACYKLRAVPINVNFRYVNDELAYLCDDADLVAVIAHGELVAPVLALAHRLRPPAVVLGVGEGASGRLALRYEDVVASGVAARDFAPRSPSDHYILYTGGTTGLPKGVVWRHEDIFFAALGGGNPGGSPIQSPQDIARTVLINRAQRVGPFLPPGDHGPEEFVALALGPLMHASGQWTALGTLLGGGRVVLYWRRQMDMSRVLDLVEQERVVMLTLVGDAGGRPLLETLRAWPGRWDTSSLRLLGSGGSILSGPVKDGLLVALPSTLAITEAIGSSESPVQGTAVARGRVAGEVAGSSPTLRFAGRDVTMVVDDELRPIPPGSGVVGRLATRGRVPVGYYKDPERSAQTFVEIDGVRWSLPGDMASVEADGSIRLLGRGSLCINSGGEKVYPEEVEAVLKGHPRVADAVVVGIADPVWGERVVAVVQVSSGHPAPTVEELRRHCRGRLAGYKAPRQVCVVDQLPRSPAGKPDYRWAKSVATGA